MAGPSQPSVIDEIWDDARVKSFLTLQPDGNHSADFHVLLKAYRGMRAADFERFLIFYLAAGRDPNATDKQGRTLWEIISQHRHGAPFLEIKARLVSMGNR